MSLIIGVAGGSGSGKTRFIREVSKRLAEDELTVISQDDYYRPISMQSLDENGEVNFDLPTAIDSNRLLDHVGELIAGRTVEIDRYTFNNRLDSSETIMLRSSAVIIVEGLFVFHYPELHELLDLKVFIDASEEIRYQRRMLRDQQERGYPEDVVRYQWENHVRPAYDEFLEPHISSSHLVIDNSENLEQGVSDLLEHIRKYISR